MRMKFFSLAKRMSAHSNHSQHRMACVLSKGNTVISVGVNSTKTTPKSLTRFAAKHAELDAVLGVRKSDLEGSNAYIYRERKDGSLGCARPCPCCLELLKQSGIKRIYFSDYDGYKMERIA